MQGCFNMPLSCDQLEDLIPWAKDYVMTHGALVRTRQNPGSGDVAAHAPVTLLPCSVPKQLFYQARDVQTDLNLLMHKVAHDYDFLRDCLHRVIQVDDFTRRIWKIYETVRGEGIKQPVSLALNRSDYMLDCGPPQETVDQAKIVLKQTEFNTMASGAAGLACKVQGYHRAVMDKMDIPYAHSSIPDNTALQDLALGIMTAWTAYGNTEAVILFLVMEIESNIYDQRLLEHAVVKTQKGCKIIRRTLEKIHNRGCLGEDGELIIDGYEVAIVYMRTGYSPATCQTDQEWRARLLLERSKAIKCPSIHYHLAGTKKVQQVLATPGVVERYIEDPAAVERIRATFTGLYSLDQGDEGDRNTAMAIKTPDRYVLKPQREGGGNNFFGEDLRSFLEMNRDSAERSAYILMDRLFPVTFRNHVLFSGKAPVFDTLVCELGFFGVLVGTEKKIILNKEGGYLLRTKLQTTLEGGIMSGGAAIDTPFLVD